MVGDYMDVKDRIDKLRMSRGWTLNKLAMEIGVSDVVQRAELSAESKNDRGRLRSIRNNGGGVLRGHRFR